MKLYLDKNTDVNNLTVDDINNILIQKIQDYVDSTKNIKLLVKPDEFADALSKAKTINNINDLLEEISMSNESKLDKQLYNIAENIVLTYFSLDNIKFAAVLERINAWGIELTLQEYILDYYLFIKTNKYLKQFVLMHLDKLIKMTAKMIEKQLMTKLNLYNFNTNNTEISTLKEKLSEKLNELKNIETSGLILNPDNEVIDQDKIVQMKLDILNDLKKAHPLLLE